MGILQLPKRFHPDFSYPNKQPLCAVDVDLDSPSTLGINRVYSLAGDFRELISGSSLTTIGATATFSQGARAYNFGDGDEVRAGITERTGTELTISVIARYTGSTSTSVEKVLSANFDNTGAAFTARASANASAEVESGNYFIVTVTSSSAKNLVEFFINGRAIGTSTPPFSDISAHILRYDPATNLFDWITGTAGSLLGEDTIGFADFSTTDSWNGDIAYALKHDRALSSGEVVAFHRDYYSFLKPKTPPIYFTAEAAGGLVVQSLAVSTALTSPALTQHNDLAVNDLSVLTSLTEPALVQHNILVVNDLISSTLLTSPSLTQHHSLTVDDLNSATSLTEPVLTVAGLLLVDNLNSASQLTSPALIQHNVLIVDDLAVASALSNVSLTEHVNLSVNDLAVGTSVSQVTLDIALSLLVDDLAVVTSLTSPALDQHNILLVDDMSVNTLLSVVSLGGAVLSCLSGYVTIQPLLGGDTTIKPTLSGNVKID